MSIRSCRLFRLWCMCVGTSFSCADPSTQRGRQVVASFFTRDLQMDWRLGAEHFEEYLLDHDPASNWGNWNYVAGVGSDPREDRYFNVRQGNKVDALGCCRVLRRSLPVRPVPRQHAALRDSALYYVLLCTWLCTCCTTLLISSPPRRPLACCVHERAWTRSKSRPRRTILRAPICGTGCPS